MQIQGLTQPDDNEEEKKEVIQTVPSVDQFGQIATQLAMQNQVQSEVNAAQYRDRGAANTEHDESGPAQQDQSAATENIMIQSMPEIPLEKPYEEVLQQKSLDEISPDTQDLLRAKLEERRIGLRRVLLESTSSRLTEEKKKGIQRLIWVLTGILDHNLKLKKLLKFQKDQEKLGLVLEGYDYVALRETQ